MKKLLSLLLAAVMLMCFTACGNKDTSDDKDSERKRATAGQDTTTSTTQQSDEVVLDTGLLTALDKSYAKSNKANVVYDSEVFMNLEASSSDTIDIACVGDSITYGTIASDPETYSYPTQLQGMLNKRYGSNKFKVTNYGHEGAYIADFERSNASTLRYCNTNEYIQLRKDKPDVVIMMLGTNDIGYISDGESCKELQEAYSDLIGDIKSLKSNPVVFVCTPLVSVTAYSSYLALDALNNAIIGAANEQGVYVIDTYNITKEYFEAELYETDGLNPNDAGYKYLAETVMNAICDGLTQYQEKTVAETSKYVVYVDSSKGTYDSVGATADKPTSSLARAIDLCRGGGTIVVSGPITPATTRLNIVRTFIAPENEYKITVTSVDPYDGTDYRSTNNARIFMSASMYLNGDFEFTNVTFDYVASATKIACNYNNVTFGSGVSCTVSNGDYSVLIYGHDVVSKWQTDDILSCKEDCTLTVNSGTFTYLRGGNYRAYSAKQSSYTYGTVKKGATVNIIVNDGKFTKSDGTSNFSGASGTLSSAIGQNGMESGATVNLTVNGGTFAGSIFGIPRMNPYPSSGAPTVAGDINITVNGGVISGSGIQYLQTYKGAKNPKTTGAYSLTINGGTFPASSTRIFDATGCSNATFTLSDSMATLANWSNITGFKNR